MAMHHFLIVCLEFQGIINPARHLAHHLVLSGDSRVTLTIPTSAYRIMFPSAADQTEETDGVIHYTPYSNGAEDGLTTAKDLPAVKLRIKDSLSVLARNLDAHGRPVTCIVYALLPYMAADVARELGIPSVLFWIQPAAVFAIWNYYFNGYADTIHSHHNDPSFTVALPGLPSLQIRDLPSLVTTPMSDDNPYTFLYLLFQDVLETLAKEASASKPRVLVNTFQELEFDVLRSIDGIEMLAVGPLTTGSIGHEHSSDLYKEGSTGYMEFLDTKAEKSVVYISFGSISKRVRLRSAPLSSALLERTNYSKVGVILFLRAH